MKIRDAIEEYGPDMICWLDYSQDLEGNVNQDFFIVDAESFIKGFGYCIDMDIKDPVFNGCLYIDESYPSGRKSLVMLCDDLQKHAC